MMKGYRWLAVGAAGISLVIPGKAHAQNRAPVEQPLGQPGVAAPGGTGTGTGSGLPQAQGSFKPPAPIRPGQPISVLVFPFGFLAPEPGAAAPAPGTVPPDGAAGAAVTGLTQEQQHIAGYVTAAVKAGFLSSPFYTVASYHPNSSLIQRAQKDEILRPEHVQNLISPTSGGPDVERARTVTYRLGMQGMLVGTIDLKSDAKANTSEVTLETQLINSTTGEVIRSAAVSGAAAGAAGVPLEIVEERAAQDAAQKVLPALGIQLVPLPGEGGNAPKAPAAKSKSRRSDSSSDRDAKKAAADAKKADEAAKRQAKEDSEKAERAAREQARASEKAKRDAEKKAKAEKSAAAAVAAPKVQQDALVAQAAPAAPPAPAPPAQVAAPEAAANTVPGTANASGQPVPYGYALGDTRSALPQRDRSNLKVPAWLGVAAFLTGLSFVVF